MASFIQIGQSSIKVDGADSCSFLTALVDVGEAITPESYVDLELQYRPDGIRLRWNKAVDMSLDYHIDFHKVVSTLRSFPAPKQGAFNQALGKKTRSVIDATGGWGGDALLMCMQGYRVSVFERHPVMHCLLKEAFQRLALSSWVRNNGVGVPDVVCADAISDLEYQSKPADCVYLDPMFPPKRKKSAAVNKQMQFLQWLLGEEVDAVPLAQAAIQADYPRVAVKRPDYALPLIVKPDVQFSSKLVHYDVYLAR